MKEIPSSNVLQLLEFLILNNLEYGIIKIIKKLI